MTRVSMVLAGRPRRSAGNGRGRDGLRAAHRGPDEFCSDFQKTGIFPREPFTFDRSRDAPDA
jgi:hypothetical protein